ncbi:aldo/keto reductase [Propionimicrobium sp. PCR01-08-3]|uniref:aldo/keto reductase n=1 Tax=Propionimicrobium sp. PCR01-08-3 TaxID=3052086 RepID=UPI00255C4799|nr:aldo/keto reductase [Propionimicrobium sp. PCR01-08-3]WIY83293.1 aldo/keto reductase [Propionimicrobium sp. PCR01-08-3]
MSTAVPSPLIEMPGGVQIPQLGFGTYKVGQDEAYSSVQAALEAGYRHIDTAEMYGNEAEVGKAIAESGVPRDEVFITSKLNNPFHEPDAARKAFAQTLEDLQVDHVDLFLIHWPLAKTTDYVATWRTMLEFQQDGRARAVGVSNFEPEHLHAIIDATGVTPAVNQIEIHPYLAQQDLVGVNNELGIVTESWSPLGRGSLLEDPVITSVAEDLGRSTAQVIIRWHLQRGLVVIPKSVHPERIAANADVFDFELTEAQMGLINALDRGQRTGSHPDKVELA